ncbi:MAG: tetratricopeptide repeat protein [Planctomycetes bacterium]|nr:tetratricopeptide repeat protein [Planctomycetota bacterium]
MKPMGNRRPQSKPRFGRPEQPPAHIEREDIGILAIQVEALMQAGRLEEALAMAGEVIRADIMRPDGFLLLGDVHFARGEYEEAADAFERAMRKTENEDLHPAEALETLATALSSRAKALMLLMRWEDAGRALRRLRELAPTDRGLAVLLAEVELLSGRPQPARALLDATSADSAEVLLHGITMLLLEDQEGAMSSMRCAFMLDSALRTHLAACDGETDEAAENECAGAQLIERLDVLFTDLPEVLQFMVDVAQLPAVEAEVVLAQALAKAPDGAARLRDLLDAPRLAATTRLLLSELGSAES